MVDIKDERETPTLLANLPIFETIKTEKKKYKFYLKYYVHLFILNKLKKLVFIECGECV